MNNIKKTIIFARNIRINALKMVASSNSPHIGSCLSIADILAVLFSSILKHNPKIKNYPTNYLNNYTFKKVNKSMVFKSIKNLYEKEIKYLK